MIDRDIIGLSRIDDSACALILKIRDGKLIGKRHFIISDSLNRNDEEIVQSILEKWYMETDFIPKEIYLPVQPEQSEFILDWLMRKKSGSLKITVPQIGDKKKLVKMAALNAEYILRDYHISLTKKEQTASRTVLSLQRDLRLDKPPLRIECIDNSNIGGSDYVSSVVVFVDGKPKKKDYRKFKMNTVAGNDDYAAMREVIGRRYSNQRQSDVVLPDLLVIDGGKGQLSSAVSVLKELGIAEKLKVIGLAKRLEEIFLPDKKEPVLLPRTSGSLRLLQHLRDEAHRFAITYHRNLRKSRVLKTELTDIPGIGIKTASKLLAKFGSLNKIKNANPEALREIIGEKLTNKLLNYFNDNENV